jgi:hypothetical protein
MSSFDLKRKIAELELNENKITEEDFLKKLLVISEEEEAKKAKGGKLAKSSSGETNKNQVK